MLWGGRGDTPGAGPGNLIKNSPKICGTMPSPSVYLIERGGEGFPLPPDKKGRYHHEKTHCIFHSGIRCRLGPVPLPDHGLGGLRASVLQLRQCQPGRDPENCGRPGDYRRQRPEDPRLHPLHRCGGRQNQLPPHPYY